MRHRHPLSRSTLHISVVFVVFRAESIAIYLNWVRLMIADAIYCNLLCAPTPNRANRAFNALRSLVITLIASRNSLK